MRNLWLREEDRQREMTVVFVDLRAFTSRAEQQSPSATFEYLNAYFAAIVPEIHGNGGVVDKYLGDGLMALFPDAPAAAVQAALGVVERSRELGAGVGVGVHLGPVTLGLVGAAGRMESTVVSDSVNIAARMEQQCEPGRVNISETTYGLVKYDFNCQSRGKIPVKNKGEMEMYYVASKKLI